MLTILAKLAISLLAFTLLPVGKTQNLLDYMSTCHDIRRAISGASDVYFAGHPLYLKGINHWASSSTQLSACVVEPGTPSDIAVVLGIVGKSRTPFAVKGGGHTSNPGFSSTEGVHISMYRFNRVRYDANSGTAEVGAGLLWDDVYEALEPYNVNVVGGRVTGVGVAGFILGGGYSWKTNQYGLTVDTVTAFELVKPTGEVEVVTQHSDPDLFFGLKGGMNNFGIVTKFTLRTFPQTPVWGGPIFFSFLSISAVSEATAAFAAQVTDPKASIITTYQFIGLQPSITLLTFYDGPNPPPGIFDDLLAIPHLVRDVKTRSFVDLVKSFPAQLTSGQRAAFHTASIMNYTANFIEEVVNESIHWGASLTLGTGVYMSYSVEPFLPTIYNHNAGPSAFPFRRSTPFTPLDIFFGWALPTHDTIFHDAMRETISRLEAVAIEEGQTDILDEPLYPNYAIFDTPIERVYGSNLPALRQLKQRIDPENVMGLAGGFKV